MKREVTRRIESPDAIPAALKWAEDMIRRALPAGAVMMRLGRSQRTLEQNSHFHPLIRTIKQHAEANGAAVRSERWWRYVLLGKFGGVQTDADPFATGGVIVINRHTGTSSLDKETAADFITWLYDFGIYVGIDWTQPDLDIVREHGRAS